MSGLPKAAITELQVAEALRIVVDERKVSTSLLQRRMRIGYATAYRLVDYFEEVGIVSMANGSKPRTVLVKSLSEGRRKLAS